MTTSTRTSRSSTSSARWPPGKGATLAQVALAWVAAQGFISIPGTTKVHRLEENWASRDIELTEEEKAELRSLIDKTKPHGARFGEQHAAAAEN